MIIFIRKSVDKSDQQYLADTYIIGEGIEIGALHHPLQIKKKK
jgi:hypothetical protein